MRIDYVSSAMAPDDFATFFAGSRRVPGQQAQKFNRLMIEGLSENGSDVHAVTARPITLWNYPGKYLPASACRRGSVTYSYCATVNVRCVRVLGQMLSAWKMVRRDLRHGCDAVVCDVLNASPAFGAVLAARRIGRPIIGVVTDLPKLMVTGTRKSHAGLVQQILRHCSGYVLLTEAMNEIVNPEGKPFVIMEGLCDPGQPPRMETAQREKVCLYAGLLDERYGVRALVEGFLLANVPDAQLHLYGDGPYAAAVKEIAAKHLNIVYHGIVMNDAVVRAEQDAALLINPRPTSEEFTKYSFPSKNMEYMASGSPVLTTRLPGMPAEYEPYVFFIEQETAQGIASALQETLSLSSDVLRKRGTAARKFVIEQKNRTIQTARVLALIEQLCAETE